MRILWVVFGLSAYLVTIVPVRSKAYDGEADPDSCRVSWLPCCPDTNFIDGFDDKLVNITTYDFAFHPDFVVEPIDSRTLDQTHCRDFLRSLFDSLSCTVSYITSNLHEFVFNPLSAEIVHEWDQTFLRTIGKHVQHAELDLTVIQSSVDEALRFIATAPQEKLYVRMQFSF